MHINWGAFGEVCVVSFGVAVGLIVLFAVGVSLLSAPAPHDRPHLALAASGEADPRTAEAGKGPSVPRRVTAWVCFAACALSVAYGLSIIIAK